MTDTPDWADEEAAHLEADFMYPPQLEIVAAALRAAFLRGRIAGLREAAEMADKWLPSLAADIRAAAYAAKAKPTEQAKRGVYSRR